MAAVAAAGVGAAVDVGYVVLAGGAERGPSGVFYAAFLGVMAALALAGASRWKDERIAQALLYGAASGYFVAGVVGLASIGVFLVVAALLAYIAAGPRGLSVGVATIVSAVPIAVFLIGSALTLR